MAASSVVRASIACCRCGCHRRDRPAHLNHYAQHDHSVKHDGSHQLKYLAGAAAACPRHGGIDALRAHDRAPAGDRLPGDPGHRPGGRGGGVRGLLPSDHYTSFPGATGLHTTDAWATLAGLARETTRIQLGTLVSPVTFRTPGELAKVAATVDEMSGGRVEVGVGGGWNDKEHAELGLPYPDTKTRIDQMEEELIILRGLWDEPDGWSFEGVHWQVRGLAVPAPLRRVDPARRRPTPAQHHRGRHGQAAVPAHRRAGTRTSTTPAAPRPTRSRSSTPTWTRRARPSAATRRASPGRS